jgi:predicted transcriptional regulator
MKGKPPTRKGYNTPLDVDLMKRLRFLAVAMERGQNNLLEEAIRDLLKKHEAHLKKLRF